MFCRDMRGQLPWILRWAFSGLSLTQVLPKLHSDITNEYFVMLLMLMDIKIEQGGWILLCGCVVVSSMPDSRLWAPACVLFTRLVSVLLNPLDVACCSLFCESIIDFDLAVSYEHTFSWDMEQLGVISSEERLDSLSKIVWGAANDYSNLVSNLDIPHPTSAWLDKLNRSRSLMSLLAPKLRDPPGPLSIEAGDVDLMLLFCGEPYHTFCMLKAVVQEGLMEPDWHLQFHNFIIQILKQINAFAEHGLCSKIVATDQPSKSERLFTTKFPEFLGTLVGKIIGHVLDHSKNSRTAGAAKRLLADKLHDNQVIIKVLEIAVQHSLDIQWYSPIPEFDRNREAAQLAEDLRHGCNLGMISTVDFVVHSKKSLEDPLVISRKVCARYAVRLCQIPKPEFLMKLPQPLVYWSFEILHVSLRLRVLIFAQILFMDLKDLDLNSEAKGEILAILDTLPLYLDTTAITSVSEELCLVVSQHAPVDFDNLDAVYDRIINVLVQNDERIQQHLIYLRETLGTMFDPSCEAPFNDFELRGEFLAVLERICQMVSITFWVYAPIFDTIFTLE